MKQSNMIMSEFSLNQVRKTDSGFWLSLYSDTVPTPCDYKVADQRLSIAFPKMTREFFLLLKEFVARENFTAKRLTDAVNHVIMNFQYKELNISDIIKFDRRIKLYTYHEVCDTMTKGEASDWSDFKMIEIEVKVYWVKKTDLIKII